MQAERNKYKDLLVIVIGFSIIGLLLYLRGKAAWTDNGIYVVYTALGLGVICIFSETVTTYVTKGWMLFGKTLGKINSTILLSVLFIVMLSPMAILKRLTSGKKKDVLNSKWEKADSTTIDFGKMW